MLEKMVWMSMEDGLQGNPNYYTRKKTVAHMSSIEWLILLID